MLAGKQIVKFARNIDALGFFVPRLIDQQNRLLCGDGRVPGSGTVVIAAEKTRTSRQGNRSFDTDAIVRRWQTFTGKEAICASAAATFTERDAAVNAHNNNPRRRERANEQE